MSQKDGHTGAGRPQRADDQVFELRRYTLRPGQRETLIALFDREFVETQEAVGMSVVGQFRDLNQPDHFVWFRGFSDMEARREALTAFYTGPTWAQHGPAANATMLDSDNVLLLKPAGGQEVFAPANAKRPGPRSNDDVSGPLWLVATHHLVPTIPERDAVALATVSAEVARAAGTDIVGSLISEHAANSFARLPVRENESVVVTVIRPEDDGAAERAMVELQPDSERMRSFAGLFVRPPEIARLAPTARSRLR